MGINSCSIINFSEFKSFSVYTLGCKVNQYESMAIKSSFIELGFHEAAEGENSDLIIINTCSVTHVADKKSRQIIRRLVSQNPEALVLVMGCYAQLKFEDVKAIDGVDIVIGTEGKSDVLNIIKNYFNNGVLPKYDSINNSLDIKTYEEISSSYHPDKTRAFIKVQDGCNLYCTYCIIPYARGQIRSRRLEDIYREIDYLLKFGYKELVLTGIHLSSYGLDIAKTEYGARFRLIDLIESISVKYPSMRIRLGSLEPGIITKDFVSRIAKLKNFCEQFYLSLQSGSDFILKAMNRRYNTKKFREAVEILRQNFEKPAISTDIIVGFPGETDNYFQETYDFCKSIGFASLHVFPYSPRQNTPAACMPNQINKKTKAKRVKKMIELAEKMEREYLCSLLGSQQEIVVENTETGVIIGRARNYSMINIEYHGEQILEDLKNNLIKCKINGVEKDILRGVYDGLSIL